MKAYYDARASEYDDWWFGTGLFAARDRPGWAHERDALIAALAALPPARTLDVACGTGFLTQHLPGAVVGLDQSATMCELAGRFVDVVRSEASPLPFPDGSFERVFTSHFYGHLEQEDRLAFLREARRVAAELVVVDAALRDGVEPEQWQQRVLNDGSRWTVYKRYFSADGLLEELGGGGIVFAGDWFVAVRA